MMKNAKFTALLVSLAALHLGTTAFSDDNSENLAKTLEYTKWSGDLNVPDPVAISFDNQGRAYVTQTVRRKAQDLDIRNNRDWIPHDVSLQNVDDKRAFYRSELSAENSAANAHRVKDYNADGIHDYRDLMVLSERIYLLEDSDQNGVADRIGVFAEDFKTEVTGIAAGVLWDDGAVYSTIAPDVWKLHDTDGDGVADQREIIATGFGNHIAYGGHDMHGLIMGPDGKLYWSIGDKGISVKSQEGKLFHYPNQGGVMRCNPDGSDFEVFAYGLRNIQEFAFDEYGNWFGVDNDSDQKGESERFIYLVEGMDAGWRCNYQYRKDGYNPWMAEDLHIPHFDGQAAYILPAISNYVDGPAGFVYNPGTALNPGYKDYFFINSTLRGSQHAFQTKENGASFVMVNDHKIGEGKPLIGLTFGPDGALYTPDWGGGYPMNERGAVWKIDDQSGSDRTLRKAVAALLSQEFGDKGTSELRRLLNHPDQRIRLKAQFEFVKRKDSNMLIVESETGGQIKRIHAIWGLGQLARQDVPRTKEQLISLLGDEDSEIQVQATKMLTDLDPGSFDGSVLRSLLKSPDPRVRFQVGIAIGNHRVVEAFDEVVEMIANNDGSDLYLRHSGIMALEGIIHAEGEVLIELLVSHPSKEVRLSAVVALRRNQNPKVARFLNDESPDVVLEAARAIHDDFSIAEALPELADMIRTMDTSDPALAHRVINANLRLGTPRMAKNVARFVSDKSNRSSLRVEAVNSLSNWVEPPLLDRVEGRYRTYEKRDGIAIAEAVGETLNKLLKSKDRQLVESVVIAAKKLNVRLEQSSLYSLLRNKKAPVDLRVLALESLNTDEAIEFALVEKKKELRSMARDLLVPKDVVRATELFGLVLENSKSVFEKQRALAGLALIASPEADVFIEGWAKQLADGDIGKKLQLDVIEASTKRGFDEYVMAYEANRKTKSPIANYLECVEGGDPKLGEEIVNTNLSLQCVRCHRITSNKGSKIGPNLKNIGRKDSSYILRSLVDPGGDIADGFGVVNIRLKDGTSYGGQLGDETADTIELLAADGSAKLISKESIESQTPPISTMPPVGLMISKRDLRDVVAYLSELGQSDK